jgi:hypothetical protein
LKSASHADRRAGWALALIMVTSAVWLEGRAQRATRPAAAPAWVSCAGNATGATIEPVRRLPALSEKALVEKTVARVFAQREKEQRVAASNLGKARLSIDFLYVAGDGPARMYYYEASKTVPDAGALLRVSVSGWLGGGTEPRSLGSKSELQWIELVPESDELEIIPEPAPIPDPTAALVPLGVLARGGEHTWVMRRQIGRGTTLVYDIGASGVRLRPAACKP